MIRIAESGVVFELPKDYVCHIEKSSYLQKLQGVKICEFIWLKSDVNSNKLFLVEAKSSIPKPDVDENGINSYEDFFNKVYEKILNAFTLFSLAVIGKLHEFQQELSTPLKTINWNDLELNVVLVIPNVPIEYAAQLSNKLASRFSREAVLWGKPNTQFMVCNRDMGVKHGLIQ